MIRINQKSHQNNFQTLSQSFFLNLSFTVILSKSFFLNFFSQSVFHNLSFTITFLHTSQNLPFMFFFLQSLFHNLSFTTFLSQSFFQNLSFRISILNLSFSISYRLRRIIRCEAPKVLAPSPRDQTINAIQSYGVLF